jgi:hypothetical protein
VFPIRLARLTKSKHRICQSVFVLALPPAIDHPPRSYQRKIVFIMYFPLGWPKLLDTSLMSSDLLKICFDRVKVLFAILSEDELSIWYTRVSVKTL